MNVTNIIRTDYENDVVYSQDGDMICATRYDFENLQESPAGFGETEEQALQDLVSQER